MKGSAIAVVLIFAVAVAVVFLAFGTSANNVLFGRVTASVGEHAVVVTDCYRLEVPLPERLANTERGEPTFRYAPCRDAVIELRGRELTVNGVPYGPLGPDDTVTVDHGTVLVNEHEALPVQPHDGASNDGPAPAPS